MIYKALQLIQSQINQYIHPLAGADEVVMGNIALNESADQNDIKDKVILSLVNIEEESSLKNTRNYQKLQGGGVEYFEPPIYLNLYLLFSAHYPQAYDTALRRLSSIIRFFQNNKKFDVNSAQPLPDTLDLTNPDDVDLYLTMELYTMTFEQINHLWGSLGGKQMPSVMYKTRLVKIFERKVVGEKPLIEIINTTIDANTEKC